jgi:acetyl-CoA synthetase
MPDRKEKLEGDVYYPSKEVLETSRVKDYDCLYRLSIEDREGFWEKEAGKLTWYRKWDKVLDDSGKPFYKWYTGGKINIVANAIDRHLVSDTRNKLALIWEGEPGDVRTFSFFALNREVSKFGNVLKALGARKGDVITIYMPQIPELIIAMLACAKIGAAHSVVYGGFSVEALAERIADARSNILITADGGYRRGKPTSLKNIANEAMRRSPTILSCIVVKRTGEECFMESDRDFWYHDLMSMPIASAKCETEVMDAEDPLFILYTSATTILYEGAPNYPYPNRWWQMIEKYGINILYTSPTAIRGLMRFGSSWAERHDLSSLRLLGSVGEPINPEAWKWYYEVIGKKRCPIMDTWWQTATGGFMITPLPITPLKPGSATKPFFGNEVDVVDEKGNSVKPGEEGNLVIKNPWPGMARTILGDPDQYIEKYWKQYREQGWYLAGDSAKIDRDGYVWIIGRIDDVLKVSGYRLGSAEIESALVSHPAVTEAAAIGLPDKLKGNIIHATVILAQGFSPSAELENELKSHVQKEIGPIARPEFLEFADSLPKTRSGKIMRRVLKAKALGQDVGDLTTLEE